MQMGVYTVLDTFRNALPTLGQTESTYKKVKPSSKTTAQAVPPWCLLCKADTSLMSYVEACLQRSCIAESNVLDRTLGTEFVQLGLDNEADLVTASALYVVQPILEILQVVYGKDSFSVRSEVSSKMDDLYYLQNGEKSHAAVRVDLVFHTTGPRSQVIAVVEYKRREQIKYADFEKALLQDTATQVEIACKVEEAQADVSEQGLLISNALSYTKQVATYARTNTCKRIALLNWDHILLFSFNKLQDAQLSNETTAGETAELTWVSETHSGHHIQTGNIRKALLGFILEAFEEHFPDQAAA